MTKKSAPSSKLFDPFLPVIVVPAHDEEHLGSAIDLAESAVAPRVAHAIPEVALPRLAMHEHEEAVLLDEIAK